MRAVVVRPGPQVSVQDVARGWVRALRRLGVHVGDFNLDDRIDFYANARLKPEGADEYGPPMDPAAAARCAAQGILAACYTMRPDFVLFVSGWNVPPDIYETLRARGERIVLLHTEAPYEDDRQVAMAHLADVNLVNDPAHIDRYTDVCPASFYVPHSYDPEVHRPRPADPAVASDFVFVGSGFAGRRQFLEAVDWPGVDVRLAGAWWDVPDGSPLRPFLDPDLASECPNDQTARLYTSAKTSANLYRRDHLERVELADGWAMGPREVELAACGTWFARQPRPEGDGLFPMLPTFTTPAELGDLVRWALAHPDQRQTAADAARAAVAPRTFDAVAAGLLGALERLSLVPA